MVRTLSYSVNTLYVDAAMTVILSIIRSELSILSKGGGRGSEGARAQP